MSQSLLMYVSSERTTAFNFLETTNFNYRIQIISFSSKTKRIQAGGDKGEINITSLTTWLKRQNVLDFTTIPGGG